ncbi:hypothetical protein Bhyg_10642 [Pseudolycoriella hygida]|uniref:Uncharacterized protein n=1 Tax=Pseudolycoriella hygida TaxID=35572 RepID=A0A9Q0MTW8_9DIPT|nr:hypothetical protein Bhyg_10642 [Pseudolycoriella hygida]
MAIFQFTMKHALLLLTSVVVLFNLVDCNPSTVCLYKVCSGIGGRDCRPVVSLVIRNRYSGTITGQLARDSNNANFHSRTCSSDGVFCLQTFPNSFNAILYYANRSFDLLGGRRANDPNSSCRRNHNSPSEWWLDL